MNIIEGYKQKAREGFNNAIASLQQDHEDDDRSQTTHQSRNKLIEEVSGENETQDNYEEEQFTFFAKQVKEKQFKCVVCKKVNPKYTCPKCKVRYCSIQHYKTHNLYCSERFYKGEVESLLKRTKMGKEEKKKMIEMLRANETQQFEDQKQLLTQTKIEEIDEARLEEILRSLQNGKDVRLTDSEIKNFEAYLKDIQYTSYQDQKPKEKSEQEEEMPLFQEYFPFWNIEEGLQQYFVIGESVSVEDYNKSQHKQVIEYRRLASLQLRKQIETLLKGINLKKTSVLIVYDLVQTIYLTALLFRSFNGEYLNNPEFIANFTMLFDECLAKKIADSHPNNLIQIALHDFPTVIPFIKSALSNMKDIESLSLFRSWLPLIIDDAQRIFKNKYLCLQSLWRLIEALKKSQFNENSKIEKKAATRRTQLIKKLQYLLVFTHQIVFCQQQEALPEAFKGGVCLSLIKKIIEKDVNIEKTIAKGLKIAQNKEQRQKEQKLRNILA